MKEATLTISLLLLIGFAIAAGNGMNTDSTQGNAMGNGTQIQEKEMIQLMDGTGNMTQARTSNGSIFRLSNGQNTTIKIMPETASENALNRLRLKNCNESNNCTMQLKEVEIGNQTRLAYQVNATKQYKILGIFSSTKTVSTEIDAETGEEIATSKPWWSFLATSSN